MVGFPLICLAFSIFLEVFFQLPVFAIAAYCLYHSKRYIQAVFCIPIDLVYVTFTDKRWIYRQYNFTSNPIIQL